MQVGGSPAQSQQTQNAAQGKNQASKAANPGSGAEFANALNKIGKNLSSFVPKINQNAKTFETSMKKMKGVADALGEEIPTLEDEAEELVKKIEKFMGKKDEKEE